MEEMTESFTIIDNQASLEDLAGILEEESIVACDLEADSMYHYREKVCLLQMAGNGESVVIDPLQVCDLSPLNPVFKNKRVCKVFHGSDYDVRSLNRDFAIEINNLFDTQLASMFLGERETSLGAVVSRRFGIQLDKRYQKKDWSQRPLPEGMIDYAASDVFHLIPLAHQLMTELDAKGRLEWVREECRYLAAVRPVTTDDEPLFLRCRGAGRFECDAQGSGLARIEFGRRDHGGKVFREFPSWQQVCLESLRHAVEDENGLVDRE